MLSQQIERREKLQQALYLQTSELHINIPMVNVLTLNVFRFKITAE